MPLPGGKSFDQFVSEIKEKQGVSDETARKIVGSIEKRMKTSKMKLQLMALQLDTLGKSDRKYVGAAHIKPKKKKPKYANKHNVLWYNSKLGKVKTASLVDEDENGKFAKYWLLNAKDTNGNGWGVTQQSIAKNIQSFINKPFVITARKWIEDSMYGDVYDHPHLPTNDMNRILSHQEHFRVGNIVDVHERDGQWFAVVARDPKYAHLNLPAFCSPAIYQLNPLERDASISKWTGLHLAGLEEDPAYGAQIAILRGSCDGPKGQCVHQLREAKQRKAIKLKKGEVEETKRGIGRVMKAPNKTRFEERLFDKFMADDTDAAKQLGVIGRTRDDEKFSNEDLADFEEGTMGALGTRDFEQDQADMDISKRLNPDKPHDVFDRLKRIRQGKFKLARMQLAIIEGRRKADHAVSKVLPRLPKKSIFGVSETERELEGTMETGDKRVIPSRVDDPDRHNKSGTFRRSFSKKNANKGAALRSQTNTSVNRVNVLGTKKRKKPQEKVAVVTKGNTTFGTLSPEDITDVEDIDKNIKPLKGTKAKGEFTPATKRAFLEPTSTFSNSFKKKKHKIPKPKLARMSEEAWKKFKDKENRIISEGMTDKELNDMDDIIRANTGKPERIEDTTPVKPPTTFSSDLKKKLAKIRTAFDFKTNPRESIRGRRKTLENKGVKLDRRIPTSNIGRNNIVLPSGEQRALDRFVNTGEKVDPRRQPFGDKINRDLKKKLARMARALDKDEADPLERARFDEQFGDIQQDPSKVIPPVRVETFSKFPETKTITKRDKRFNEQMQVPINKDKGSTFEEGSPLGEKVEELRINRKLLKDTGQEEGFMDLFKRKFGPGRFDKPSITNRTFTISADKAKKLAKKLQRMAFDFKDNDGGDRGGFLGKVPKGITDRMMQMDKLERAMPVSKELEFESARSKSELDFIMKGKPIRPNKRTRSEILDFKGNRMNEPTNIVNFDRETKTKSALVRIPRKVKETRETRINFVSNFVNKSRDVVKGQNIVPESKALEKFLNKGQLINIKAPGANKLDTDVRTKSAVMTPEDRKEKLRKFKDTRQFIENAGEGDESQRNDRRRQEREFEGTGRKIRPRGNSMEVSRDLKKLNAKLTLIKLAGVNTPFEKNRINRELDKDTAGNKFEQDLLDSINETSGGGNERKIAEAFKKRKRNKKTGITTFSFKTGKLNSKLIKMAVKLIKDEEIRKLREGIGPGENFPDDNMKRSPEDARRNFAIQTRGIASDRLKSLGKKTRRDNPKTPLVKEVPFGKESRPKKNVIGDSLKDEDESDAFMALDFADESNPIVDPLSRRKGFSKSRLKKPKRSEFTRIIGAKGISCMPCARSRLNQMQAQLGIKKPMSGAEIVKRFQKVQTKLPKNKGFTFNPETGNVFDATDPKQALGLRKELGVPSNKDVFFDANTRNITKSQDLIPDLDRIKGTRLVGGFIDKAGKFELDATTPVFGGTKNQDRVRLKKERQIGGIRVTPKGQSEFFDT